MAGQPGAIHVQGLALQDCALPHQRQQDVQQPRGAFDVLLQLCQVEILNFVLQLFHGSQRKGQGKGALGDFHGSLFHGVHPLYFGDREKGVGNRKRCLIPNP